MILMMALTLSWATCTLAQSDDEYAQALQKMIEVSGGEDSYKVVIHQFTEMYKEQYPEIDAKFWKEFEKEFQLAAMNDLVVLLVPVYQKHLTLEDLNDIIAFYQTRAGKKFADKLPMILKDSMEVGAQWGAVIGERFARKMQEKGY